MITAAEINAKMPAFSLLFRRSGFVSLDNAVFVFDQDGLTAEAEFYANDGPTILIFNQEVFSIKARLNNAGLSLSSLLWICASTLTSFGVDQDCLFTKSEFNEKTADRLYEEALLKNCPFLRRSGHLDHRGQVQTQMPPHAELQQWLCAMALRRSAMSSARS